jgi:cytochrome P450
MHHLELYRDQRQWLIEHPDQIPATMDEFVRYFSPATGAVRTAARDTSIGGVPIMAGSRVMVSITAGNRDPEVFDHPEELLLDRSKQRSLSFGIGAHFCVGVHLARLEYQILLTEILSRMPDYIVDIDASQQSPHAGVAPSWTSMPARTGA